jgi:glycosyltransferase 2 family protein
MIRDMRRLHGVWRFRHGPALLATLITVAFAYLAVRNVDFGELSESLRESNYWWLLPGLAALVVAFLIRAIRWRALFSPETRPALWATIEALIVGHFFNNVLPLRAGEVARIVALHSLGGRSRAETTGTVVVERFFDVLGLLVLLFAALPWFPVVTWLRAAGILAIALTVGLVTAIVVLRIYGERPLRFVFRPLRRLPLLSSERIEAAVRNLMHGLIALRSARIGVTVFLWTLLSWLVLAVSFWLVMLGFDLGLSPVAGLLVVIAVGLSLILPSAPAAVGVFEAAVIVALAAYDVPNAQALSFALVVHALNVLPFILGGLLVIGLARGILQASTSDEQRRASAGSVV